MGPSRLAAAVALPVLVGLLEEGARDAVRRVVDEDINPAEGLLRSLHRSLHLVLVADVAEGGHDLGASGATGVRGLLKEGAAAARRDDEPRAFGGERLGCRPADVPSRARDEHDPARETHVHGEPLKLAASIALIRDGQDGDVAGLADHEWVEASGNPERFLGPLEMTHPAYRPQYPHPNPLPL